MLNLYILISDGLMYKKGENTNGGKITGRNSCRFKVAFTSR